MNTILNTKIKKHTTKIVKIIIQDFGISKNDINFDLSTKEIGKIKEIE